jgi:CRP-like cAMP-binding protein/Fe-S-cluster-containing dehydrogenase component
MSIGSAYIRRDEEEGLFARDIDGHLVRMDAATAEDLDRDVSLTIDGRPVTVKKAVPATDAQGNFRKDERGRVIPRATTIYDAATALFRGSNPIPLLCHREHMNPVAVCRVCVVEISKVKRGKRQRERKLLPACQHRVEETMVVETIESPDAEARERVRAAVRVLVELLMADHPTPCAKEEQVPGSCELEALARRLGVGGHPRFGRRRDPRGRDDSSLVIAVDHDACILCDRCIRGCNDIRDNQVIGRMAKGYQARIAFDLDKPMGSSSCVACGECMASCPTGALTHRASVAADPWKGVTPPPEPVRAQDLLNHPLPDIRRAFEGVARPFLDWNSRAVVRRRYKKGDIICREGDFGATAFLIERGSVEVYIRAPRMHVDDRARRGAFGLIRRFTSRLVSRGEDRREEEGNKRFIPIDAPVSLPYGKPQATMGVGDIFGEMTCMSSYPRSATVRAAEDCTVLELLRSVLYIMQRSRSFRGVLEQKYRERVINNHLRSVALFDGLRGDPEQFDKFLERLRERVRLRRCDPGEVIFRQGAPADDGFYLVRSGFVKVTQGRAGGEHVLSYVGPGGYIGEIGLMAHVPEVRALAAQAVRTASCAALDHVDLVRITAEDFAELLDQFPAVRQPLVEGALRRLRQDRDAAPAQGQPLGEFLRQGLMNAQSLLVLDLEKCTRCDECTKACSDAHDGVTRLIREGLRFDKFLVASSCRSCLDPYCMVGCPVGSIRRRSSREILIEDWCIGCGKCAENCPYGNINMHPFPTGEKVADPENASRKIAVVQQKATVCDLCIDAGGEPSCVYACPHDAAHRMTGFQLRDLVEGAPPPR